DVPKLGYARQFKGEFPRPDGSVLPIDVIIGSGLYNPAPDEPLEITLTVSPATLMEDGGVQTVTVTATQSSAPIPVASVIDLSLSGTATADDYSVTGDLVITIPARATEGSTELTFTVTDDTVYESGGETIVITARSEDVDLDSATISVTDSYDAPATIGTPPAVTLEAGDDETVDAGPLFSGTDLSYSASSTDNGVVEAVMSGAALTVTGVRKGGATVTVSARNAAGEASLTVSVTVTAVAAEREAYTNILAAMGRSMLSGVSSTIGGRFSAVGGREITVGGRRIDGLASGITALAGLTGHGRQSASKEMALLQGAERRHGASGDYLLRTSSFSYAMEDHTGSGGLRWSVWGAGDLQNFQGEPGPEESYDGNLRTAYLGFDVATGRSWLAGIAFSRAMGESDYDVTVASGSLESRLTAVLPYLHWTCPTGFTEVWSIVGLGTGEAEVEDGTSDLSMRMGMLGARSRLASSGGLGLDLVGDAGLLRLSTSDSESAALSDITTGVQRIRVGLEGSRSTALAGGTTITPYAQVAGRYDGGDGQTGQGLEVSGGLRLTGGRVGLNARGRFLAVHTAEGYRENGVSLVAYLRPQADGRGLSMSVAPRMGAGTTDSGMMWREQPLAGSTLRGGSRARSLQAEVGYGLASSPTGVLFTPFGDLYLDGDERRQLRLGARLGAADLGRRTGSLELSGTRIDRRGAYDHRIGLVARMSF
ncbi:MAG: autotransporter domain-containing protein, partial [Gemmatimonadetes bacterium]|nr:autotransporter domain-containing protein [Gemmatimonadota bacterium]